jgi:hypothetical protein
MNDRFAESVVEDAALAWLEALGYAVPHGPDIALAEAGAAKLTFRRWGCAPVPCINVHIMYTTSRWSMNEIHCPARA